MLPHIALFPNGRPAPLPFVSLSPIRLVCPGVNMISNPNPLLFVCRKLGPNEVTVRLGIVDLKDPVFIERKVNKAEENSEVDLVLLRMEEQVYFHEAVSPICLPHDVDLNLSGKVEFKF